MDSWQPIAAGAIIGIVLVVFVVALALRILFLGALALFHKVLELFLME